MIGSIKKVNNTVYFFDPLSSFPFSSLSLSVGFRGFLLVLSSTSSPWAGRHILGVLP